MTDDKGNGSRFGSWSEWAKWVVSGIEGTAKQVDLLFGKIDKLRDDVDKKIEKTEEGISRDIQDLVRSVNSIKIKMAMLSGGVSLVVTLIALVISALIRK